MSDVIRRRIKRPLWGNYLVAFGLIGYGFMLTDLGVHDHLLEIVGGSMFITGLLVFVAAIGHSIWLVIARRTGEQRGFEVIFPPGIETPDPARRDDEAKS